MAADVPSPAAIPDEVQLTRGHYVGKVIAGSLTSPRLAGDGGAGRWDLDDAEYVPKLQV